MRAATRLRMYQVEAWSALRTFRREPRAHARVFAVSTNVLALGGTGSLVVAAVAVDRIGKGVRTAPRDALISLSTPAQHLGRPFGVHRALDSAGAMLGRTVSSWRSRARRLPADRQGSGLAVVTTRTSVARLFASVLFGALWSAFGMNAAVVTFFIGLVAALAIAALAFRAGEVWTYDDATRRR